MLLKTLGINVIKNATPRWGMGAPETGTLLFVGRKNDKACAGASLEGSGTVALEARKSKPVIMRGALNPRRFSREQLV